MPDTTFIYGLVDPRTQEIRYIGKADNPKRRLSHHLGHTKTEDTHKARWISNLKQGGLLPEVFVIEEVERYEWEEAEHFWIAYFTFIGCHLTNGDSGGAGTPYPTDEVRKKMSINSASRRPEIKAKIAEANRRRIITVETREKLSQKSRNRSPETREKLRQRALGHRLTAEQKDKLYAANIGRHASTETRTRMSMARRGKKLSDAHKSAISAGLKGKKKSKEHIEKMRINTSARRPEVRAKISAAMRRVYAKRRDGR